MAFKGTITLIALKEDWYQKLQRHKGHCEKKCHSSPSNKTVKGLLHSHKKQAVNSKKTGPYC